MVLEWRKREREGRGKGRAGGREEKGGGVLFLHNYVIQ